MEGKLMEHRGMGHPRRRGRGRGRPFKSPYVNHRWKGQGQETVLELFDFELEVLKLIDLEGFTQEKVALKLRPLDDTLSRGNINRYLQNARQKVVQSLLSSEHITLRIINTQKNDENVITK